MIRSILTLCCLGLLGGAIAGNNAWRADWANSCGRWAASSNLPSADRYFDCQHALPLVADAEETDDAEELSGREKVSAAPYASGLTAAGPSPRAARFEAAIQHRLANTLNALGVRLQI